MKNKILKSVLTLGMLITIVAANYSFPSLPISPDMSDNGIQPQTIEDESINNYK